MGAGEGHIYLELRLASYLYFITLIKRMEDLDCAHIYMNSISYQTEEEKSRLGEQRQGAAGSGSGKLTQPSGFHTGGSVDCVSKKAVPWHR